MPLAMGKWEIQADISNFSLLAGDPSLSPSQVLLAAGMGASCNENISLSPFWARSSLHPQKDPWPGHRHGETEAQSGAGLHPVVHARENGQSSFLRPAHLHLPSPSPTPSLSRPPGGGRELALGSPRCETYLERGGGPWGWAEGDTLQRRLLCWEPAKCFLRLFPCGLQTCLTS